MSDIAILKASKVSAAYIARLTIKNILRAGKLRRYLQRFPDDMLAHV